MSFMTPEMFNILIIMNIIVGLILAGLRFRQDMTRRLPFRSRPPTTSHLEDTQPKKPNEPIRR